FPNLGSVRQLHAGKRERNFVTNFVIRRAADNLALRPTCVIDFANREPISVRMTRRRGDLRNDHLVDLRAARLDVFGFNTGASQQFGDLFRIVWKIDKFAEPINGEFHFPLNVMSSEVETSLDISSSELATDSSTALGMTKVLHANWRRNRKSFCAKRRRSGMSNKIIARRSMPRPNA